ncbi:hypothetical protein [Shimia sp.]|uniref:hypothetical protein n=1 Tax=Shimia sp. TaxID=1954381 RepID=UPI003BA89836
MSKSQNQWEDQAREMAARIDRQMQAGEQLALLPDEVPQEAEEARGVGRPKGAKNKTSSQMRDYLASRGFRMPEEVLVEIAGLSSRDDAITLAMKQAERILAWAFDGAHIGKQSAPKATSAMRLEVFRAQYTMIMRATEALMPYMAPKATPDAGPQTVVQVNVPSQPADAAASAKDVTPQPAKISGRMMPADVRHRMQQNQTLNETPDANSDGDFRTE